MAAPKPWLKPGIWLGALTPLGLLGWRALGHRLGANPIAEFLNQVGLLALIFLVATLACTPLQRAFRWTWPARVRRTLGVFSFFYACLHFGTYAVVDQGLALRAILGDVVKRPFILVGFSAFVLLVPLAVTSTDAMVRRLGYVRWKRLHRLTYAAAVLGAVHFILRVKKDLREPVLYAAVLGILLFWRLLTLVPKRRNRFAA